MTPALVTASFGLIGQPKPVVQRWLRIDSVQLGTHPGLPVIDRVHLIAQVNGVSYAYPTSVNTLYAPIGPGMVSERYPLPIGADTYRVRFYGFGVTLDGKFPRYEQKGVVEHPLRMGPFRNATQNLQLSSSDPKALLTGFTVRYSIE